MIYAVRKRRREWFRILRDLMASGISMKKVASACGKDEKTVRHWADGGEPKDSDAQVVLALYQRFCPDKYLEHIQNNPAHQRATEGTA